MIEKNQTSNLAMTQTGRAGSSFGSNNLPSLN